MSARRKIRLAHAADAEAMLRIYRPSVMDASTSFETELPTIQEFQSRISETCKKFPWLAYELDGEVVGYAYAGPHRSRCAYGWSVESTVYVSHSHHRMGVGHSLYGALFELLKDQGVVNVFAGITMPNDGSVTLHEKLGFKQIGLFEEIGFKMGQWWDVSWWQLKLQRPEQPRALQHYPTPFERILS